MIPVYPPEHNVPQCVMEIGHQGENEAVSVIFDIKKYEDEFGPGTWKIINKRPGEEVPYVVSHTQTVEDETEGILKALWIVDSADTGIAGEGRVELRYYVDEVLVKTDVYRTRILPSLGISSDDPPDPAKDLLDTMAEILADTEAARDAAKGSEENAAESESSARGSAASAATSAASAANSATSAAGSATGASQSAASALESAAAAAESAETAAAVSGGNVYLTDMDDGNKQYHMSFAVENGIPVSYFTAVESEESEG